MRKLYQLQENTIEKIISNDKIFLRNEDQLLQFIIELCCENSNYFKLYEYVYFENASNTIIEKFINHFNIDFITQGTWNSLTKRFIQINNNENCMRQYIIEIPISDESNKFKGIIAYLRENKSNIDDEINITSSTIGGEDKKNLLFIDDDNKRRGFHTQNIENSSICFEFKKRKIMPTGYTIRSHYAGEKSTQIRYWVIEGSNDNIEWSIIDDNTKGYDGLNGAFIAHTFHISDVKNDGFKFIRIRQTGKNWNNNNYLHISSIEFYGKIIS